MVLPPMVVEMEQQDPLVSSLYVTDIGYYPNATNHFRQRKAPIDQYVLIYCVDGSGFFSLRGKEYQVERNQFFILPAGVPHKYGARKGGAWTIYWVHFYGEHAAIYAKGMQTPQSINVAINSRIRDRINIFDEILTTLQESNDLEHLRYASSVLHHFLASIRFLRQYRHASEATINTNPTDAAIHFMRENIENHISLQDVLDYVGYSQSYFSAVFKQQTGESPHAYFLQMKIEHARKLLEETDLKVNQICHKIGIDDPYYFSRLFSQMVGCSPQNYRKAFATRQTSGF